MIRSAVAALAVLLVLGAMSAAGASLIVTAPVTQVFRYDVDPPPVADLELYVDLHLYAGASNQLMGTTSVGPFTVPDGEHYRIGYDGSSRPCEGDDAEAGARLGGPFPVSDGTRHLLCVQHGQADGRVVSIQVGDEVQRRTVVLDHGGAP